MIPTSEFRNGLKIEMDGVPYQITYFQHVKPGKGGAFVRTKLKSLLDGRVLERTFKSGDKVGTPDIEEMHMQYLYNDGESFHFMNTGTYEQYEVPADAVGETADLMKENAEVSILFFNSKAINIQLPTTVELEVTHCEPGVKGDTATNVTKPATIETGAVIAVPLFVKEGDVLKIDTRSGEYLERVSR
jgi:elongation factor P